MLTEILYWLLYGVMAVFAVFLVMLVGIFIYVWRLSFHQMIMLLYYLEYGDPDEEGDSKGKTKKDKGR